MTWRVMHQDDRERQLVNMETGQIRKVAMASDKQLSYLQSLRAEEGKEPVKHRPTAFAAAKAIDKLLERKQKREAQQKLL